MRLSDEFEWRRIVNTYKKVGDVPDIDWYIIGELALKHLDQTKKHIPFQLVSDFFQLYQSLVSSNLSLGERADLALYQHYQILYMGKKLKSHFNADVIFESMLHFGLSAKELSEMISESINGEIKGWGGNR